MKYLFSFLLFISLLGFSSCEDSKVSRGRDLYELYFDTFLKDPKSFVVYEEVYTIKGGEVEWEVEYGAKNSFGAMSRERAFFSTTVLNEIHIDSRRYKKERGKLIRVN